MNKMINIVEVGPRDGFQNVSDTLIPTQEKKKIIDDIVNAGVKHIEFTSFVSPKTIPQMADAAEVAKYVLEKYPELDAYALVPNLKGVENAYKAGLRKIVYVVSFSKSHNKANINRTHEQSLEEFRNIKKVYPNIKIVVDFATVFGCPFEGKYHDVKKLLSFMKSYMDAGMESCCLCDTIGIADPVQVREVIQEVKKVFPTLELMVHFHDTRGCGMANTLAAFEAGVEYIQTTLGGFGGCPFAPGASGNLSTEDVVWVMNEMGYQTGVSFQHIKDAARWQKEKIKGNYSGHQINIDSGLF